MKEFIGPTIITLSVILYAILPPLLKKANQDTPPFTVMTISMFFLFIASLVMSVVSENFLGMKLPSKNIILILAAVGLINTVAFWLGILAFKYMPIWQQEMFVLLSPIFAGFFAYFILGEPLSSKLFVGLTIMSLGLYIAVR